MVDVFFDSLDMNHRIDYKDRLEIDPQIEQEPKSGKWRKRALGGTKKPWYNEVSDWA